MGVLILRALLFGVFTRAPHFWKLPYAVNLKGAGGTLLGVFTTRPLQRAPLFSAQQEALSSRLAWKSVGFHEPR